MFRRNASPHGEVDLLKEVKGSEGQTTLQDAAEEYEIIYSKGDIVALKHNYKRYIIPFSPAVVLKDLHHKGHCPSYVDHRCLISKETIATKNFTSAVLLVYNIDVNKV